MSGGVALGFADGMEELLPSLIEGAGGVIIADGVGESMQGLEGDAGFEESGGIGQ